MQEDRNVQGQMKVLVIDDEADQAGINTADVDSDERKAINALIRNLVNGKQWDDRKCDGHYQAMNYIGYTATPYANVLNESGADTLYPKDFIATLSVSNEYFGPQQIFGCDDTGYEGIDMVNIISQQDIDVVKKLHKNSAVDLPQSLKDSICWFICGVACMRYWEYKRPISMLVHTSQNTEHHSNVAQSISDWIQKMKEKDLISECHRVWDFCTNMLTLDKFLDQYPDYGVKTEDIKDYPDFSLIEPQIHILLGGKDRISHIQMSSKTKPRYHEGIHLCVDNCKNNGIENDMMVRLMYPGKDNMPNPAPAFIVVGGATLSRGLTLEGLISTYFLRSVKQSDTLMQMGRWFGYRKTYELMPRIWMSKNTEEQFKFLALLDQRLRDEIHRMETLGINPSQYGPRVMNSPRMSFIRIVAKNRMQKAHDADKDFSGASSQTQLFDNNAAILKSNLETTRSFLRRLGDPEPHKVCNNHANGCIIWRNISFGLISDFLKSYSFQKRQNAFKDLDAIIEWIQKMTDENSIVNWNVVLAGVNTGTADDYWEVSPGVGVYKVTRSQKTKNKIDGVLNIGALRVPKDIISDIDLETVIDDSIKDEVRHFQSRYAFELREKAGLSNVPQLLLYIIDKNSKPNKSNGDRCPLDAKDDVVGISLTIPGESKYSNNTATVSVLLDEIGFNNTQADTSDED